VTKNLVLLGPPSWGSGLPTPANGVRNQAKRGTELASLCRSMLSRRITMQMVRDPQHWPTDRSSQSKM